MKLQAYQAGLSIETTEDQTIIKGSHSFGGVLVQESYTNHKDKGKAIAFHIEAMQTLLNVDEPISSTKEELPQPPQEIWVGDRGDKLIQTLKARRARLLERIQDVQEWMDRCPSDEDAQEDMADIKDELVAVESALGYPEAKEPEGANKPEWCPECLCLLQHEDPMQSCQCGS